MSALNFFKRGTMLVPSGPPGKMHLHVICTNPDPGGLQILVSISTVVPGHDEACILLEYQHPWLFRPKSFVDYRFAALRNHRDLIEGVKREVFVPKADIDGQTFGRIRNGIENSRFTPGPIKRHYRLALAAERAAAIAAAQARRSNPKAATTRGHCSGPQTIPV